MKNLLLTTAALFTLTTAAMAGGAHNQSHDDDHTGERKTIGSPASAGQETRTVEVAMFETDDGHMLFEPRSLDIKKGEIVLFNIVNKGELEHEFVLDTVGKNQEHKASMAKMPEMEHDDPNSVRLEAGETDQIVWNFTNGGTFEFACLIPGHYESGMHGDVLVADKLPTYTKGLIKRVTKKGKVTVKHGALVDLGMSAMTMVFRVADDEMLGMLSEGKEIEFLADRVKGKLTITKIK
ncbi:MAG: copper-binding protein [Rhodobacteraceae bacterium]|nr:copper-binding protein [Paracoccaceae bacterium]